MLITRKIGLNLLSQRTALREWSYNGRIVRRHLASTSSSGGAFRVALVVGGVSVAAVAGTVTVASYNADARQRLYSLLPFLEPLLSGVIRPQPPPSLLPPALPMPQAKPQSTGEKIVSIGDAKSKSSPTNDMTSNISDNVAPPPSSRQPISDDVTSLSGRTDSLAKNHVDGAEDGATPPVVGDVSSDADVSSALSVAEQLTALSDSTMQRVHEAIAAQQRAEDAVNEHSELLYKHMSEGKKAAWSVVDDSASRKRFLCETADNAAISARESLDLLRQLATRAEVELSVQHADLVQKAWNTLARAHHTFQLAQLRHNQQTHDHTAPPPTPSTSPPSSTSGDNRDSFNYNRQQLQRRAQLLEADYRQQLAEYQQETEAQLTRHLSRQAAAHAQHLQDELKSQQEELRRCYLADHEQQLREERGNVQQRMITMIAQLQGIQHALKERSDVDKTSLKAQRLFTACQALYDSVITETSASASRQLPYVDVAPHLAAVRRTAGDDRLVGAVLKSLTGSTLSSLSGDSMPTTVSSLWQLRRQFARVERTCRQVALVNERGGSLFKYAVSYLHSLLTIDTYKAMSVDVYNDPVTSDLDTINLLARARHAMDVCDLSLAVRYLGQLRGEAARAAASWLADSRQLLELQQAAVTLVTHAAATNLHATQAPPAD